MVIRILLIVSFAPVLVLLVMRRDARFRAMRALIGVFFVALVVYSVIFPDTWQSLANSLGVGRGADLLLYLMVVAFITFAALTIKKLREIDRRYANLVRRLAIRDANLKYKNLAD